MNLPLQTTVYNLLVFLEYLHSNKLSPKVIQNYLSSIRTAAIKYNLQVQHTSSHLLTRFIRSISINSPFAPTPRGVFEIKTMYHISRACDSLSDPHLFRAIFLTAYFAFLRMSNVAPHSTKQFDPSKHFLRQDAIFGHPGIHLIVKWTKTLQDHRSHHIVQLPELHNPYLCPVRALRSLLSSRPLPPTAPLFATIRPPHPQIIDTHIRNALKSILQSLNIPPASFGFHTFRRSGATFAFDHNVSLQNIMSHGLWRSSAVWIYLQNASLAPSTIPCTFRAHIPPSF